MLLIEWEGKEYAYDPSHIDVKSGIKIEEYTGLPLMQWEQAVFSCSPKALVAFCWEMKRQAGEIVQIQTLNFSPVDLHAAFMKAVTAELEERSAERKDGDDDLDPTVTAPSGSDPTTTPGGTSESDGSGTDTSSSSPPSAT